jgi:predicted HTH domain antitoxin
MASISINVPEMSNLNAAQLTMVLASHLYERGSLSLGQAAEMASLSKRTFAELLGAYGVSLFNYPAADLSHDAANAYAYS